VCKINGWQTPTKKTKCPFFRVVNSRNQMSSSSWKKVFWRTTMRRRRDWTITFKWVAGALNSREKREYFLLAKNRSRYVNSTTSWTLYKLVVRPSVVCQSVNTYFASLGISLLSERISMKLATNVYRVSGNCWRGFQSQRSKIKVMCIHLCECCNGGGIHFYVWRRSSFVYR